MFAIGREKNDMDRRLFRPVTALLVLVTVVTACGLSSARKPAVVIVTPISNDQFQEGDPVRIESTASDPSGIARVELIVDGTVVRTDAPDSPQQTFQVTQTWQATAGTHQISVRAYDTASISSDPAVVQVAVLAHGPVAGAPTLGPTPGLAPPLTTVPSNTCTDDDEFVTDVTIPDDTVVVAQQSFDKTWRIRNTGSCMWNRSYQFTLLNGQIMATTPIPVPDTAPGATVDLRVPMTAPAMPGTYNSFWRIRNPLGMLFGPTMNVTIHVVNPNCAGTPNIAAFTASPTTITAGQSATLSWGLVSNADEADIDNGIGGVATPASVTVTPNATTTFTLTAHCGSNTRTARVTISVVSPPASPSPSPVPTVILPTQAPSPTSAPPPTVASPTSTSPTAAPSPSSGPTPTVGSAPTATPEKVPPSPTIGSAPTATPPKAPPSPTVGSTPTTKGDSTPTPRR